MIYDCSLIFNELDLLEIRLNELKDLDCKHIIVESSLTHQGAKKPYNLEAAWDRFKDFHHKMIYLKLSPIDNPNFSPWTRENYQRDYIAQGLKDAKPDDIVFISDIDEIPNKKIFEIFDPALGVVCVRMRMSYYFVNCIVDENWFRPQITTYRELCKYTPNSMRYKFFPTCIENGGWHFSYLGGVDKIREKVEAYSHSEFNNEIFKARDHLEDCIKNAKDFLQREGCVLHYEKLNESYPKYLLDNQEKFKHLIAEVP